ncbi:6-chlorohydroxyquinol-1,2-dioxygenase [Pseudooceanicola sp. 216_PA32_1]|uniref:6-chlorohydroxyquinol-1,2-dioxygenase n=1 Tax=Pseudooceanicola pacificus TaxID=2676438 RepID=A0A844WEF3_9RHOB|nr:dioxygenase [Pseudooceanicola pacificus]MWB79022.1 6-chlorohydroxyquinol-1,2-dioxygenase [Pseudooceanicola pacificus]
MVAQSISERSHVAEDFAQRLKNAEDPRAAQTVRLAVEAICDIIAKLQPTRAELQQVIAFLTAVGEACHDTRHEWVLLCDVLGITSEVEAHLAPTDEGLTPPTLTGPFYRPDAAFRKDGESISLDGRGVPLEVVAHVHDIDGTPIEGAVIEVWQANGDGLYENQDPDAQPEFNLRGRYRVPASGRASIRTVRPAGYRVPDDGPVGALMKLLGLGLDRPAHIHFRISAPGHRTLTTHVFDRTDPCIADDPLLAVRPELLADFTETGDGGLQTEFRFVLAANRTHDIQS